MAKKDIKRNPAAEKIADLILSNYDVLKQLPRTKPLQYQNLTVVVAQ